MIFITRPPAPEFMTDPDGLWCTDTRNAIAHYAVPGQTSVYHFQYYNRPEVKLALKAVFTKCAYCDSFYADVYDGDVEHFRPKLRVKEKTPQTPGYYWLANEWENLLLSCQHCNQRRRHLLDGDTRATARGKLDQFPIADNARRATRPADSLAAEDEVRYLLNPCLDNPEEHLAYDQREGVIIGLTARGEKSIDVYVLQRPMLVFSRGQRLLELMHQIETARGALLRYNADPSPLHKKEFDLQFDYLIQAFTSSSKPFAGMCRYFVRIFLAENQLIKIKQTQPVSV